MKVNKLQLALDAYKKKKLNADKTFEEIYSQEEWPQGPQKDQIIQAKVVNIIEKSFVEVYTGWKSNSFIPFKEFKINDELNLPEVGSFISVINEGVNYKGQVNVSYRKVKLEERLKEIEQVYLNNLNNPNKETIECTINAKQKVSSSSAHHYKNNTYYADLGYGVTAIVVADGFIDLDNNPNRKFQAFVNRFEIGKNKRPHIILGIKRESIENTVLDSHKNEDHQENISDGEIVNLQIAEYKDFGIICKKVNEDDRNDTTYFIANTELAVNKRIRKKSEIISLYPIGKQIKAVGVNITDNYGNIKTILSVRDLFKNLMHNFIEYIKSSDRNQKITGTIVEKRESELIIKIDYEGSILEGKLHRDELNWNLSQGIIKYRSLNIGDKIEFAIDWKEFNIENMDVEYGFLPLSVKILYPDPLKKLMELIKIGQVYSSKILGEQDQTLLLALKLDDNTWTDQNEEVSNVDIVIPQRELKEMSKHTNTKPGALNNVKVIKIDTNTRFVYVSIKSVEADNLAKYSQSLQQNETGFNTLESMKRKK